MIATPPKLAFCYTESPATPRRGFRFVGMKIRGEGLFRGAEFIGPKLRLLDVPVIAERRARHVTRAKCLLIALSGLETSS